MPNCIHRLAAWRRIEVPRHVKAGGRFVEIEATPDDTPQVAAARALTADLCRVRRSQVTPYVSGACYESSARLLESGETSWQHLP
jgi:hypothetical protein